MKFYLTSDQYFQVYFSFWTAVYFSISLIDCFTSTHLFIMVKLISPIFGFLFLSFGISDSKNWLLLFLFHLSLLVLWEIVLILIVSFILLHTASSLSLWTACTGRERTKTHDKLSYIIYIVSQNIYLLCCDLMVTSTIKAIKWTSADCGGRE